MRILSHVSIEADTEDLTEYQEDLYSIALGKVSDYLFEKRSLNPKVITINDRVQVYEGHKVKVELSVFFEEDLDYQGGY